MHSFIQKEAIENGTPYNIILTDYKMPEMDGFQFSKAIREVDQGETSIFLVTGYNYDILEEEARDNGGDEILSKPLFRDTLLRSIQTVYEKKGLIAPQIESAAETINEESSLEGLRVLMAEDVDASAEILADLLDLEGIESERAADGEAAVTMFQGSEPGYYDAILMDVRMPIKDGLTATAEIRLLDKEDSKTIPIIAMTANVFDEDVERSLAAGMNAHLSKPIEPDKLYNELRRLTKK